jgi:hypothetical protein
VEEGHIDLGMRGVTSERRGKREDSRLRNKSRTWTWLASLTVFGAVEVSREVIVRSNMWLMKRGEVVCE